MLKKWLLSMVAFSFTAGSALALSPKITFMNGWSVGVNGGYQKNKITIYDLLSHSTGNAGVHVDCNRHVTNRLFFGAGLEITGSFRGKTAPRSEFSIFKLKRLWTSALTLRVGTVVMGKMALEINGSLLLSRWHELATGAFGYDKRIVRSGYAPGVAATMAVGDRFSVGVAYRYEIYPQGRTALQSSSIPTLSYFRMNAHQVTAKFSYRI